MGICRKNSIHIADHSAHNKDNNDLIIFVKGIISRKVAIVVKWLLYRLNGIYILNNKN